MSLIVTKNKSETKEAHNSTRATTPIKIIDNCFTGTNIYQGLQDMFNQWERI